MDSLLIERPPEVETEEKLDSGVDDVKIGLYPSFKKVPAGRPFTIVLVPTPEEVREEARRDELLRQAREDGKIINLPPRTQRVVKQTQEYYQFTRTMFGTRGPLMRIVGVGDNGKIWYELKPLARTESKQMKRLLKTLKEKFVRAYVMDPLPPHALKE